MLLVFVGAAWAIHGAGCRCNIYLLFDIPIVWGVGGGGGGGGGVYGGGEGGCGGGGRGISI